MKILYLNGGPVKNNPTFLKLVEEGYDVEFYNVLQDERSTYNWTTRHFQMYQDLLDYAEKNDFDLIYFDQPLPTPEILYFELKTRPTFKPKIIFHFYLRGLDRSQMRCLALKNLISLPQVYKAVITSMITENLHLPKNMLDVGFDMSKIHIVSEAWDIDPVHYKVDKVSTKKEFGFKENDFILLSSGSWSKVKGGDLFLQAIPLINKKINIVVHINVNSTDMDYSALESFDNVTVIKEYLSGEKLGHLYAAANMTVCPHRTSYTYSESAIPGISCLSKNLIVAPNFYYFNEYISKSNVGVLYEPENPSAMATAINYAYEHYREILEKADFDKPIKNYTWVYEPIMKMIKEFEARR